MGKIIHGMTDTSEYNSWESMRQRCLNENHPAFKHYGGRGIIICQSWLESFINFYENMGDKPSRLHSIDRRENNGNYEPKNCYWATNKEQQNNKRNNRIIEFDGKKQNLIEWSELTGINHGTIYSRLKLGWSVEKTLTTPDPMNYTYIAFNNKTQSLTGWGEELNINPEILQTRHARGWCVEKMLTQPIKKYTKDIFIYFNGQYHTIPEWSKILNIKDSTLYTRLERGRSTEEALGTPIRKYKN